MKMFHEIKWTCICGQIFNSRYWPGLCSFLPRIFKFGTWKTLWLGNCQKLWNYNGIWIVLPATLAGYWNLENVKLFIGLIIAKSMKSFIKYVYLYLEPWQDFAFYFVCYLAQMKIYLYQFKVWPFWILHKEK